MKKMWRKLAVFCALLFCGAVLCMPATVQAKKAKADKGVALTEKNFPDVGVLAEVKKYDKDGNGYLSKKEQAAVTEFYYDHVISDFSQLKYFTNIKKLSLAGFDWGLWLGSRVDLTMFPKLETVWIEFDTESHWADASEVQLQVSGLKHLKELHVYDEAAGVHINVVDFRDTPALRDLQIGGVKGVIFDDGAKLEKLGLYNVPDIPKEQIENFKKLKELSISTEDPKLTKINLLKLSGLASLDLRSDYLKTVETAGADALESLKIKGGALKALDLSENLKLTSVTLDCPSLEELHVECPALESLNVSAQRLAALDVSGNPSLSVLYARSDFLETIDVGKNPALTRLTVQSDGLKSIDVSNNPALENLELISGQLVAVDTSKNIALKDLRLETKQLKALDLTKNKKLKNLRVDSQELTELNTGNNKKLRRLSVSAPKLETLDLSANTALWDLSVKNTALSSLELKGLYMLSLKENKKLERLDVSGCPGLHELTVEDNAITSLNLLTQTELRELTVAGNKRLAELKMASNVDLMSVVIKDTAVQSLVFPKQHRLQSLVVSENPMLTELDLSKLPKLLVAVITDNAKLTELDFSKNSILYEAHIDNNPLSSVTFGEVPNMAYLYCQNTALAELDLSGATRKGLVVYCDEGVKVIGYRGDVHTEKPEKD